MTIALGLFTSEGIVIAADSEVSQDLVRVSGFKVFGFSDSNGGSIVVTGAGDTHYLQSAASTIGKIFIDHPQDPLADLEPTICEFLIKFYDDHVLPFTSDPPDISLIIGARRGGESRGWSSEHNLLKEWGVPYVAVGVGEIYARSILGTFTRACDFESAKIMAAYVVWLVKQRVAYCGKDTQIVCLGPQGASGFTQQQIRALEVVFADVKYLESVLFAYVFGSKSAAAARDVVYKFIEDLKRECAAAVSPQ